MADETRQAIQANDYELTVTKGNAAIAAYEELEFRDRIPEIQAYIHRAEVGLEAIEQLQQGEALLDSFRFFEAEEQIHDATVMLQSLDNQTAAQRGTELLTESVRRQSFVAYGMLIVGQSCWLPIACDVFCVGTAPTHLRWNSRDRLINPCHRCLETLRRLRIAFWRRRVVYWLIRALWIALLVPTIVMAGYTFWGWQISWNTWIFLMVLVGVLSLLWSLRPINLKRMTRRLDNLLGMRAQLITAFEVSQVSQVSCKPSR